MSHKRKNGKAARKPREVRQRSERNRRKTSWLVAAGAVVVALFALGVVLQDEKAAVASPIEFTDVKSHTEDFIGYYKSIQLTPEQELVKRKALSAIRAPCCSDNTAYTCCCPCNMAKSWWGLSHHLIANEGYGAEKVQAAVEAWIDFIGPNGFSGNACYTGGCPRPFHRNGCGGMNEDHIVF